MFPESSQLNDLIMNYYQILKLKNVEEHFQKFSQKKLGGHFICEDIEKLFAMRTTWETEQVMGSGYIEQEEIAKTCSNCCLKINFDIIN